MEREVAQAGSALGLGPRGRRFESCLPDKQKQSLSRNAEAFVFRSISPSLLETGQKNTKAKLAKPAALFLFAPPTLGSASEAS